MMLPLQESRTDIIIETESLHKELQRRQSKEQAEKDKLFAASKFSRLTLKGSSRPLYNDRGAETTVHESIPLWAAFGKANGPLQGQDKDTQWGWGVLHSTELLMPQGVLAAAFSSDGTRFAVAGLVASHEHKQQPFTPTVIVYDLMTLQQLACLSLPISSPTDPTYQWPLLFVPKSSNQVLTATAEGKVIAWNLERDDAEPTRILAEHSYPVNRLCASYDGSFVASSSISGHDSQVEVHELSTTRQLFFGNDVTVVDVCFAPHPLWGSNSLMAVVETMRDHGEAALSLWDGSSRQHNGSSSRDPKDSTRIIAKRLWQYRDFDSAAYASETAITFTPDGRRLVVLCSSCLVVWDLSYRCFPHKLQEVEGVYHYAPSPGPCFRPQFSPDCSHLAVFDEGVVLYNLHGQQGEAVGECPIRRSAPICRSDGRVTEVAVRWWPDRSRLVINWTVSDEEESKHTATQVYSWEANESLDQLIYDVQPSASLNSYAFSPNGRFLVFGMGPGSGATAQFGLQAFTEAVLALQVLGRLDPKETFDGVLLLPKHADTRVLLHGNTGIQCLGTSITHDPRCRMQEDCSGRLQRCGFALSHSGDMVARFKSLSTSSHSSSSSSSSSHSSSSFMSKMDLAMYDVVWEVGKEGGAPQPRLEAHNVSVEMSYCCNSNDTVSALAFSTDGKMLAVLVGTRSSLGGTLKSCTIEIRSTENLEELVPQIDVHDLFCQIPTGRVSGPTTLCFTTDGSKLLACTEGRFVCLSTKTWRQDKSFLRPLEELLIDEATHSLAQLFWSSNAERVAICLQNESACSNSRTGALARQQKAGNSFYGGGAGSSQLIVLDNNTGRMAMRSSVEEGWDICSISWSPDNTLLVAAANKGICVWEACTGDLCCMIKSALPCKLATMLPGNLQLLGVHSHSFGGDRLLLWSMGGNCWHAPGTSRINSEMELLQVLSEPKADSGAQRATSMSARERRREWGDGGCTACGMPCKRA